MSQTKMTRRNMWLLVATMSIAFSGLSSATAATYDSPQACFDGAKTLVKNKDYKGFCQCLTPDSQNLMGGMFSMMPSMMKQFAALGGDEGLKEFETKFAKINQIIAASGINTDDFPGMAEMQKLQQDEAKLREVFAKALAPVKDRAAYVAELMVAYEALQDGQDGGPQFSAAVDGELKDIQIDGDTATATLVLENEGEPQEQPLNFKKVDGSWLIDLPMSGPGG